MPPNASPFHYSIRVACVLNTLSVPDDPVRGSVALTGVMDHLLSPATTRGICRQKPTRDTTKNFKPEWQFKKKGNYWGEPALTVETAIMDDNGNILPRGEVGEIVRRGPAHLIEYWKDPGATDDSRKYGWDHSEDIGYFDEDGLLAFIDRKKDMIKTGGENVPSIKVEKALLADARIQGAAVVGLPHERWVEAITAFIVRQPGAKLTEDDVVKLCKENLGGFEVPKKVVFLDALPITSTGKIKKNVIKDQYKDIYRDS